MAVISDMNLVDQVVSRMGLKSNLRNRGFNPQNTATYIRRTVKAMAPFTPRPATANYLNTYLMTCGASENQCMAAWALFMDLKMLANDTFLPLQKAA
ncbi:MAG: hypothetical protein ACSHXY_01210 [Alphaproteobacteria bacterium]